MTALILAMLLCVALALAVVVSVAVPARRDGKETLTPRGEQAVRQLRGRAGSLSRSRDKAASR